MRDMASVLLMRDDKFLLVHNIKKGLRIGPAGGKVDNGEGVEECAHRETKEELGVGIKLIGKIGIYDAPSPEGTFRSHMYIAEIVRGEPKIQSSEQGKLGYFGWYSINEIRAIGRLGLLNSNLCEALEDIEKYIN